MKKSNKNQYDNTLWNQFSSTENLTPEQVRKFQEYAALLQEWNLKINLTTVTDDKGIIETHFRDSLAWRKFFTPKAGEVLCDVGAGAGFPGLPLAIVYPNVSVVLIEVIQKKVNFLREVVAQLGLSNVLVSDLDWRTFLRTAPYDRIDQFLSRASLKPSELIRAFKPTCQYQNAIIIYWASDKWEPSAVVAPYINREESYIIGKKRRRLIFMTN